MSVSTLPISAATAQHLERPIFGHVIDGEVVPSVDGQTMPVIDPATGEEVGVAALGSAADVDRAVRSARAAFDDGRWRYLAPLEKERRLRRMSTLLQERATLFGESDTIDSGLLRWYTDAMVEFAVNSIDYFSGWPSKIEGTIPPVPSDLVAYQVREPHGVLGLIVPWNGPSAVLAFVAAAISAGNSVVLKPAEQTPMTAVLMAELADEAGIPKGVLNVVQGRGDTGAALVEHPGVDALSFTGSRATGTAIQAAAAKRVTPVSLELGGKSPFIIFPDADLEAAASAAMMGVWMASGQVCTAGTRVLIHKDVHDELVDKIVSESRDIRIGSGFDPDSQLGPLVSAEQLERVEGYVAIGADEGAELALGGARHGDVGFFHQPTIFTGVRNEMRIAQEEIFGPVMSILRFDSEAEAYAIANDTEYGLGAGVWTNDLALAHRATRALRTGQVWINTYQAGYPTVAYGGVKMSGHGRMQGRPTIEELTHIKSVWMKVGDPPVLVGGADPPPAF
jgi:acyl-CoA reductase-like NAD-dependent aldehyde dehydrogenase